MVRIIALFLGVSLAFSVSHASDSKSKDQCEDSLKSASQSTVAHHHQDLDTYIAGMEKSSLQKAALGSVGRPGRLVDLGAGSGVSAYDLAVLFPDSQVTGVDLDQGMVNYANNHYEARNLQFKVGDAEGLNFEPNSLDTIFISSTLHHLTSYGSGQFDVNHVHTAIQNAAHQLRHSGVKIIRDFMIPDGPNKVILEIQNNDGTAEGAVPELSTSALFEKFAVDFRSSTHPESGVEYRQMKSQEAGWNRYLVSLRDANEFILRKDYRGSYNEEIKEEYTFMAQSEFEAAVNQAGLRVLHSAPVYNPWIIEHRYRGHVRLFDLKGNALPFPATNYMIAAEKISANEGIRIAEKSSVVTDEPRFLQRRVAVDLRTQESFDLVERPGSAIDMLPYFSKAGSVYVLTKQGYPRPIVTLGAGTILNRLNPGAYVIEPLSFLVDKSKPLYSQIESQMTKRAGLQPEEVLRSGPVTLSNVYTSPGLVNERALSMALPVKSRSVNLSLPSESYSSFSTSGVVRPIEATQALRAAQVGAMIDARLEMGVYQLLLKLGRSAGPWIGQEISIEEVRSNIRVKSAEQVLDIKNPRRQFKAGLESDFGNFLEVRRGQFVETSGSGQELAEVELEYVLPKTHSANVVSVLPVKKQKGRFLVGLEHRHLPAVQMEEGTSDLITNPAWRLPREVTNLDQAEVYVQNKLSKLSGVEVRRFYELGGIYHPSKGLSPEVVYPLLAEVTEIHSSPLQWVDLSDLIANRALIKDAHLLIAVLRAGHALDLIP